MNSVVLEIRRCLPIPEDRCEVVGILPGLRSAYREMKVGDHFHWDGHLADPYRAAEQIDVKITTRKVKTGGWTVWVKAKNPSPNNSPTNRKEK